MNEKIIALAKKMKALVDKGSTGESENALRLLRQLMAKHGLTESQLEEVNQYSAHLTYQTKFKNLFFQLIASVVGGNTKYGQSSVSKNTIYIMVTPEQEFEIRAKYEFYKTVMEQELDIFYYSFFIKHGIFDMSAKTKEPTKEEIERFKRAQEMSKELADKQFHKQIGARQ